MSPKPAAPRLTADAIEKVRAALRTYRGLRPTVLAEVKARNPRTRITLRWLQAFSDRKDKEPKFSKVVELGAVLGIDIEIQTKQVEPIVVRR